MNVTLGKHLLEQLTSYVKDFLRLLVSHQVFLDVFSCVTRASHEAQLNQSTPTQKHTL